MTGCIGKVCLHDLLYLEESGKELPDGKRYPKSTLGITEINCFNFHITLHVP
jgi:hypothetical protein